MSSLARSLTWCAAAAVSLIVAPKARAQTPGFYLVGQYPNTNRSSVTAFTVDGAMAVGDTSRTSSGFIIRAFRWTSEQGRMDATDTGLRPYNKFTDISSDGSAVAGYHYSEIGATDSQAIVLRSGQPLLSIPVLATYSSMPWHAKLSGDGTVVVGTCQRSTIPVQTRGFRWTAATGTQAIPPALAGDSYSVVYAISRDGTTIVGQSSNPATGTTVAFVWRASTGTVPLSPSQPFGAAYGVNDDGSVVVGEYHNGGGTHAALWDAQRQLHDLGAPTGSSQQIARCVSGDGTIVGGGSPQTNEATIWTPDGGTVWASDYFAARGTPIPPNYRTYEVTSVSRDGRAFGVRIRPAAGGSANVTAIVILPFPCPADFNADGGIDGTDVEAFFNSWSNGTPNSDVNHDGGIDGADVESFFHAWEAGGCN